MSQIEQKSKISREEVMAIRQARRYLKQNVGTLARILNAYKLAVAKGNQLFNLAER